MVAEDSGGTMERELETAAEAGKLNPGQTEDGAARWWKICDSVMSEENPEVRKVRTQAEVGRKSVENGTRIGNQAERRRPEKADVEEPRGETGMYETEASQDEMEKVPSDEVGERGRSDGKHEEPTGENKSESEKENSSFD